MSDATTATTTAFIVPHTHWDREWHQPFQVFRARLVDVIDRVLEILETDPDYRRFTLDGQAIVLEDYLALRPEKGEAIEAQVRAGRLRIGPWYVLADEFLVSPEALVRNLLFGRRVCRAFGPVLPVGYTPDSFGHISQLPLLARGFGLDSIVFERGVGDEGERLRGEFRWLAADGCTDIFAVHLLGTYSAAAGLGHADWGLEDRYDSARAVRQVTSVLFGSDGEVTGLPDWLQESFERLPDGIAPYRTNGAVLLLNGSDHLFPEPNVPTIVAELNAAVPGVRFVHADIEEFVAAARSPLGGLETFQGEFRGSRYQHVLSGVLSARVYLKQANNAAETRLERFAEPLASLAWLEGQAYPDHLIREAWRLLLQNHPHDSICGCSVDAVHDEMMVRFASVEQLAGVVTSKALRALGEGADGTALTVYNPLPYPRTATVEHTLELPAGTGRGLAVADAAGRALPCQVDVEPMYEPGRSDRTLDRVRLRFTAPLPALGVAGFRLDGEGAAAAGPTLGVTREGDAVRLENAAVRLDVDADGAVSVTDLASGARTPLRLAFEDEADAGDEYDFSPLAGDAPLVFDAPAGPPELLAAGPVEGTVRLAYRGELPARLGGDRSRREGRVPLDIVLDLSLAAAEPLVRLRVRVDNRAQDHRLRLRLHSGCRSRHVLADGHFDVRERPLAPPAGDGWFQAPSGTSHQRRFIAVGDGT
ncbi:MAG TPA: glycoside hydrolase family 38 C-terminal domain-containing protein, partial [Trueperaceae bacterium]|nr:glycoside hydrolase family 38 C-terminal domain-containing protein [Trueperaceae bacterium]